MPLGNHESKLTHVRDYTSIDLPKMAQRPAKDYLEEHFKKPYI